MIKINHYLEENTRQCEERRILGRYRCKYKDNIKVDLKETGCEAVDYIHLAQDGVWLC
jgi:hypothetical protein